MIKTYSIVKWKLEQKEQGEGDDQEDAEWMTQIFDWTNTESYEALNRAA